MADLPVPVAPSSTTSCSPARTRRSSSSIAAGWSPDGWKSETTWKGATRRTRSVVGRTGPRYGGGSDNRTGPSAAPPIMVRVAGASPRSTAVPTAGGRPGRHRARTDPYSRWVIPLVVAAGIMVVVFGLLVVGDMVST